MQKRYEESVFCDSRGLVSAFVSCTCVMLK